MALTLTEAAKLSNDILLQGVVETGRLVDQCVRYVERWADDDAAGTRAQRRGVERHARPDPSK